MKLFLTMTLMMIISVNVFASSTSYIGQGSYSIYGLEKCAMTVETKSDDFLNITIHGLGRSVKLETFKTSEFQLMTQTHDQPRDDVKVSGEVFEGKPVKFSLRIGREWMICRF